jgi:hypothetical protein
MKEQIIKLAQMMGLGSVTGSVPLAAMAGLFKPGNAAMLAVTLMAGSGSLITAMFLDGTLKERMITALFAGVIATSLVILSAGFGPRLIGSLNIKIMKIAGAISIGLIALMIGGIKLPNSLPIGVMIIGLVFGLVLK